MDNELKTIEELIIVASKENKNILCSVTDRAQAHLDKLLGTSGNCIISINNDTARILIHDKHEISIYNRYNYGRQVWCFKPEINWFGSSSTSDNDTVLDYLIVLGAVAKDFKDLRGFCRGYLSDLMVELHASYEVLEVLFNKKHALVRKESMRQENIILDKALQNLKTDVVIIDPKFFLNTNSKFNHPFEATLKLVVVTEKTVTVNIYRKSENTFITTKRIPREEFTSKYKLLLSEVK